MAHDHSFCGRADEMHALSDAVIISHAPAVTCEAAALARGVPLRAELKTLLIAIAHRRIAVHLRGSDRLKSRAVRHLFHGAKNRFLTAAEVAEVGLAPGTINPWNVIFCDYHLLCGNVLELDFVTTNLGSTTRGIRFRPTALLALPRLIICSLGVPE